jgi:hypothetical protein
MKPSFLQAIKSRWQIFVAVFLAVLVGWLVHERLPVTITGKGILVVPVIIGLTVFALALFLLRQAAWQDGPPQTEGPGTRSALQGTYRVVYLCIPAIIAAWLLLTPLVGPAGALRIAVGAPALMAPGFLLSVILLPQDQGLIGRLLISGALSTGIIPLAAAALNLIGIPFSAEVAYATVAGTSLVLALVLALGPRVAGAARGRSQ